MQKTEVAITLMKAILDNVRDDLWDFFYLILNYPL